MYMNMYIDLSSQTGRLQRLHGYIVTVRFSQTMHHNENETHCCRNLSQRIQYIEAILPDFFSKAIDKLGVEFLTVIEPFATFIVVAKTDVKSTEAKPGVFVVDSMGRCFVPEKLIAPTWLESKEKTHNRS